MPNSLDDFRAMPIEQLNAWLDQRNVELAFLQDQRLAIEHTRALAYRALKEKMARTVPSPRVS